MPSRALLLGLLTGCAADQPATPTAQILRHTTLYESAEDYTAWPSLIRAGNGDLLLAFTRTDRHVSPDGAIVLMRSTGGGRSWNGPDVLYDSPIDDRESGFTSENRTSHNGLRAGSS